MKHSYFCAFVVVWSAFPAIADSIVAARTIRPFTVLTADDLAYTADKIDGGVTDPALLIGQEVRKALYAGRPIRVADVQPPAVIERNQIVRLIFERNGLRIATEGRALDRAGVGAFVRVMNLSSRSTVSGRVDHSGKIIVSD